jgi:microcystin degradation protein MlrC
MRIAIGGLMHETNTFSTLPTRYEDFAALRGDELTQGAVWQRARDAGYEVFPLFVAHAMPSGRVTRDCFERFLGELLEGIRACLPLDGLLLHLHGAMEVEEIGDGETALLQAVREVVGPDPIIAVTLDLHANLSPQVVQLCDLVTGYRTAPHRDVQETRDRGARLLLDCLQHGLRPSSYVVKLPLLLAGEAAVTEVEPARSLYARLPVLDRLPGVLASSILIGCAWTDSPYTRVSVVLSGTDGPVIRRLASRLAEEVWAARDRFAIDVPTGSIEDSIRMALASPLRPVFVSDSGDNPTAGAAGDNPNVLKQLVADGVSGALVAGIADPEAVRACFQAGVGSTVDLLIGGRLDRTTAQPYDCKALVKHLVPQTEGLLPRALVQIGDVEVVLQSDRWAFTRVRDFERMGIDPMSKKLIVVKLGYLFPELRDVAPQHIMTLSPGFADQRLKRLPYCHLGRPIHPLDQDVAWHADG